MIDRKTSLPQQYEDLRIFVKGGTSRIERDSRILLLTRRRKNALRFSVARALHPLPRLRYTERMTVSLADFWKLASDSRLLTADQCRQLNARFRQVKGTPQPRTLAEWLISRNVLTRYETTVLAGQANRRKGTLADEFRDRLRQLPDHVARYLATVARDPYWEPVARRFPEMVGDLAGQSRVGTENGLVVANAFLPPAAIHNLLFASELALAAAPAEGQVGRP